MSNREAIKYSLLRLEVVGLHPEKFRTYYARGLILCWILLYIVFAPTLSMEIFMGPSDVTSVADETSIICLYLGSMYKFVNLFVRRKRVSAMLKEVKEFWPLNKFGQEWGTKMEKYFKGVLRVCYIINAAYIGSLIYYILRPVVLRRRMLPVELYTGPVDNLAPGLFELFILLETTMMVFVIVLMVGHDLLLFVFTYYAIFEFEMIKKGFMDLPFQNETEEQITKRIREYVQHHNKVLRFVDGISEIFSLFFLYQFFLVTVGECMSLFVISVNLSPFQTDYVLKFLLQGVCLFMQLLMYCVGGTELTFASEAVGHAIYNSNWTHAYYPQVRRRMLIVMHRSQKIAQLTAGGMFQVNLESCATVVKTSWSYFMLMKTLFYDDNN